MGDALQQGVKCLLEGVVLLFGDRNFGPEAGGLIAGTFSGFASVGRVLFCVLKLPGGRLQSGRQVRDLPVLFGHCTVQIREQFG